MNLKIHTLALVFFMSFCNLSFGQQLNSELIRNELDQNNRTFLSELLKNLQTNSSATQRDEDDLLIADRLDSWEGSQWVGTDSTEYYYNVEKLPAERITLNFDGTDWE